jgi:hypothetical protein
VLGGVFLASRRQRRVREQELVPEPAYSG